MLPEKIMQSDFLDILFENRNKLYGAYAIRRSYNKRIASSITLTVFIAMVFCLLQLIYHSKQKEVIVPAIITPDIILTNTDLVKPLPEKPATPPAANHTRQIISSTPVIVSDNRETDVPDEEEINNSIISNINVPGDDIGESIEMPAVTTKGAGTAVAAPVEEMKENNGPLISAQVMPEYPGGIEALQKFMLKNLKQPENLNAGEKIVVRAFFVVNKNGQIEQVKINGTGRPDLDKEVRRVINKMPLWKPGMQNGKAVAVYFNLPVTFISTETE